MSNNQLEQRILDVAEEKLFNFGYRGMNLDDIASEIGISKKTLYKYFSGKREIAEEIINRMFRTVEIRMKNIFIYNLRPEDKLKQAFFVISDTLTKIKGPFMSDLKKYLPDLWKKIDDFRTNKANLHLKSLIIEGIEQGDFRQDINPDIAINAYLSLIGSILKPDVLTHSSFSSSEAVENIMKIFLEGIVKK